MLFKALNSAHKSADNGISWSEEFHNNNLCQTLDDTVLLQLLLPSC